jgi:carboxypeptidase C (cathepsin A)
MVNGLEAGVARRIESRCYEGGHMMYRDESERLRLSADLVKFVNSAASGGAAASH